MPRSAVVMMDNRPPVTKSQHPQYPQLAFELNRRYACRHGHDLLYLQMRGRTCRHPDLGERHPSYCKLTAVAEALARGYEVVAFLDSDAYFRNASLSLPQLLTAFENRSLTLGSSEMGLSQWDVSFASDEPYSSGPNAGVQFWRNTPSARRLLQAWWNLPGGTYHSEHDFEQHALQWAMMHLHVFRPRISTLGLQAMATELDARGWPLYKHPIAHIDHGKNFFRVLFMSMDLLRSSGRNVTLPTFKKPKVKRAAPNEPWLERDTGTMSIRGIERYQTAQLRNKMRRRAADEMPHRRSHARGGGSGGGGGGVACGSSRVMKESFDASGRAERLLMTAAAGRQSERQRVVHEMLWGLPLQLVNCSALHRGTDSRYWWMRWDTPRHATEATAGLIHVQWPPALRGLSKADYCLRLGPSRAPRQPDLALAQLWPCPANFSAPPEYGAADGDAAAPEQYMQFEFHERASARIPMHALSTRLKVAPLTGDSAAPKAAAAAVSGRRLQRVIADSPSSQKAPPRSSPPSPFPSRLAALLERCRSLLQGWRDKWGGSRGGNKKGDGSGRAGGRGGEGRGSGAKAFFRGKGKGKGRGFGKGRGGSGPASAAELERRRRRRAWRLGRRSRFVGQACTSIYQSLKVGPDIKVEDCEDWCDETKVNHCRYCKCRGCNHCHGDLDLPDWVLGATAEQRCAGFGICNQSLTFPHCLSIWRGHVYEGAPVVWSRCRVDSFAHQQWKRASVAHQPGFLLQHAGGNGGGEPLCVAAPISANLLR